MRPAVYLRLRQQRIINRFHRLFYQNPHRTWDNTYWFGVSVQKNPLDLWIYQEILHETRPEVIVETGTCHGGSALYLASMMDILGAGEILTIDIDGKERPRHPRVTYRAASSTDPDTVAWAREKTYGRRTMVILDSDHMRQHVATELAAYAPLVTPGCYLIVEDTNINGHPVARTFGPGPAEAVDDFLAQDARFTVDKSRERFMFTFNPGGYLLRRPDNRSPQEESHA